MGVFGGVQKYVFILLLFGLVFNFIFVLKKIDWDFISKENKVIIFEFFR